MKRLMCFLMLLMIPVVGFSDDGNKNYCPVIGGVFTVFDGCFRKDGEDGLNILLDDYLSGKKIVFNKDNEALFVPFQKANGDKVWKVLEGTVDKEKEFGKKLHEVISDDATGLNLSITLKYQGADHHMNDYYRFVKIDDVTHSMEEMIIKDIHVERTGVWTNYCYPLKYSKYEELGSSSSLLVGFMMKQWQIQDYHDGSGVFIRYLGLKDKCELGAGSSRSLVEKIDVNGRWEETNISVVKGGKVAIRCTSNVFGSKTGKLKAMLIDGGRCEQDFDIDDLTCSSTQYSGRVITNRCGPSKLKLMAEYLNLKDGEVKHEATQFKIKAEILYRNGNGLR